MDLLKVAQRKIKEGTADVMSLTSGSFPVHLVSIDGTKYVHKSYGDVFISSRWQKRAFLSKLERKTGGLAYREIGKASEIMVLEERVLRNWQRHNISAPIVEESDGSGSLLLSYIEGTNLLNLIKEGKYSVEVGEKLIQTILKVRSTAFDKRDRFLLHNDMWVANFMVEPGAEVVPIDPGLLFKDELDLPTLDAYVNLFMCYSLVAPVFGYDAKTKDSLGDILGRFLKSLDNSTRQRMIKLNIPVNPLERAYLRATSKMGFNKVYNEFVETFSPKRCHKINREIQNACYST